MCAGALACGAGGLDFGGGAEFDFGFCWAHAQAEIAIKSKLRRKGRRTLSRLLQLAELITDSSMKRFPLPAKAAIMPATSSARRGVFSFFRGPENLEKTC